MFKKLFTQEEGFTLVELLVTIAILAVLFGITTLTLSGVGTGAATTVCTAEVAVVQSAMDIYLASAVGNSIAAPAGPAIITAGGGGFTNFLRSNTKGTYDWGLNGSGLTQTLCP
ncbi:MAG: prepilin-type N-terminal cleavage/methylation domain-containing protein [Anaerolineales bacterium]|nr:prepilin-type N-terminal cleavage/methylation domain-containing protein [Anaerolineales bacterium]